jgi:hypothetical protein
MQPSAPNSEGPPHEGLTPAALAMTAPAAELTAQAPCPPPLSVEGPDQVRPCAPDLPDQPDEAPPGVSEGPAEGEDEADAMEWSVAGDDPVITGESHRVPGYFPPRSPSPPLRAQSRRYVSRCSSTLRGAAAEEQSRRSTWSPVLPSSRLRPTRGLWRGPIRSAPAPLTFPAQLPQTSLLGPSLACPRGRASRTRRARWT